MKRCLLVLCMLAAFASLAIAADAPPTFKVTTGGKNIILTPVMPLGTSYKIRVDKGQPSGLLVISSADDPVILDWSVSVTFGAVPPGPGPVPPPDPPPVPPPPPVPTVLWGVVIEESKERTPAQAAVILSPKVADLFKADKQGQFRVVDPWDDAGARRDVGDMKAYADRAEALKIKPALFVVAPDGTVYFEGKLPEKVADMEALVAKIRKGDK